VAASCERSIVRLGVSDGPTSGDEAHSTACEHFGSRLPQLPESTFTHSGRQAPPGLIRANAPLPFRLGSRLGIRRLPTRGCHCPRGEERRQRVSGLLPHLQHRQGVWQQLHLAALHVSPAARLCLRRLAGARSLCLERRVQVATKNASEHAIRRITHTSSVQMTLLC
jgi:hypothetical protein